MPDLLHCRACGAMPLSDNFDHPKKPSEYFVRCYNMDCSLRGPIKLTREAAEAAWNRCMGDNPATPRNE